MTDISDPLKQAALAAYTGLIANPDGTHQNDPKASIRLGEKWLDEWEKPQSLVLNAQVARGNGKGAEK